MYTFDARMSSKWKRKRDTLLGPYALTVIAVPAPCPVAFGYGCRGYFGTKRRTVTNRVGEYFVAIIDKTTRNPGTLCFRNRSRRDQFGDDGPYGRNKDRTIASCASNRDWRRLTTAIPRAGCNQRCFATRTCWWTPTETIFNTGVREIGYVFGRRWRDIS